MKNITLPDILTQLGTYVFSNCTALTDITIPQSVEKINDYDFYSCKNLKSVTIKNGVQAIERYAFSGCENLENIILPNSITQIAPYGFYNASALKSIAIPSSVTKIDEHSFYNCKALENITIPDTVTEIGSYAFSGCTSLKNIKIPNKVETLSKYVLYDCKSLTDITIPNSVKTIETNALSGCTGISKITVPVSVTTIDTKALGYHSYYTSRKIDNFTIIGIKGSAADTYAEENEFTFIEKLENKASKISTSTINAGSSVTVTASFKNGTEPYQYLYAYQKSGGSWKTVKNYSSDTSAAIKLSSAGTYTVRVKCIDENGTVVNKDFKVKVNEKLTNNTTIDKNAVNLGQNLTLTGKASGGSGGYTYAVYYKQATQTNWTKAQDYQSSITAAVTPKAAATYTIRVKVKDSNGNITNKDFTIKVNPKLANQSTINKTSIKLGDSFNLTGAATGGFGGYTYAVYYKQAAQTNWTKAQDYQSSITAAVTPKATTTYTIRVKVKDANGTVVNKDFTVTVTK